MKKYACLITFGCQMNVYDSGRLADLLQSRGWLLTDRRQEADFLFFNTCSIREKAAVKVLNHLREVRALKKKKPDLIVGVGGCVAEQEGRALIEKAPWVSLVIGPQHLPQIPELLEKMAVDGRTTVLGGGGGRPAWSRENLTALGYPELPSQKPERSVTGFVTIMLGCDNYCAYCVVPYLRGRESSRDAEDIITEVRGLLNQGVRDLTLLGQNVNSYNRGRPEALDFPELLQALAELPGLDRLRFTTSHPKDFPQKLIRLFGRLKPLCEQLHLPVQSGSDRILTAMGRRYTRASYLKLVDELRAQCPDLALSTDIIVGFPGESEADFQETLSLLETVEYEALFSFKYSDRPQTKALGLEGKIAEEVKGERLIALQALQKKITLAKNQAHLGQSLEVLVEGRSSRNAEQLTGRARNFKSVNFEGPDSLIGRTVPVEIISASSASLKGRLK